ncbi:acyl-CoA carboxylase subunit epsilon [Amycolatopsis sp. WGS_07]|uniref:acyl-CoA carboxylase subunit epsilon n=1 Tax=Amycolatopsis sp. WGS_07 TaxID=3076764 RepID=UPI00387380F0
MSEPVLVVLRGAPADDEIAAVLAALWLVAGRTETRPARTPPRPSWRSRAYRMPGTWVAGTHAEVTRR